MGREDLSRKSPGTRTGLPAFHDAAQKARLRLMLRIRRYALLLGLLSPFFGAAQADSASARVAPSPSIQPVDAAALRGIQRAVRVLDGVEALVPGFDEYDPGGAGGIEFRQRFFELVLESGRADRALRVSVQRPDRNSASVESRRRAAESFEAFTSSLRWLHREVVMKSDYRPALDRVRSRLDATRIQLRAALAPAPPASVAPSRESSRSLLRASY